MESESKNQAAPCVTPAEADHMIVAAPARMQTIRVETNGGRIHGVEVDGHRLRGVVDITIGDKSGTNPPAIFIQLRGRLEFAEAGARAIQSSFIPKNGTV